MFLFEKYKPKTVNDFIFNRDVVERLIHLSSNDDIPHIIIAGPSGSSKKNILRLFLESLYDEQVNMLTKIKYKICGSSTKKEVEIMQSNYHIIIEPTNTNHDKYILQDIIKQYAMHKSFNIFKTNRTFKTIVIYNIENLSNNSQAALRRTMEIYAKNCRFIMICNNLSKVFDPLKSRCSIFCTKLPTPIQINQAITNIQLIENIKISKSVKLDIIESSVNNLKRAIWMLESERLGTDKKITIDDIFNDVVTLILTIPNNKNFIQIFDNDIRKNIYNILIINIKGSDIIKTLLDLLITRIDDNNTLSKIIKHASDAEFNLIHGRRDIMHIDYFILGVVKELHCKKLIKKCNK